MEDTTEKSISNEDLDALAVELGIDQKDSKEFRESVEKLAGEDWYTLWRYWKLAVDRLGKHSYAGTVLQKTIDKRRSRNKRAKMARKANR